MNNTNYFLMNRKTKVLKFNSKKSIIEGYKVLEIYNKEKLPYILKTNINRFTTWLDERPIPTNQEHLHKVLDSLNITSRDTMELLKVNCGFSLNDSFWIKAETVNNYSQLPTWETNNLYSNDWDEALGLVSFFGNNSSLGGTLRTPEITNQGSVGKAWRRINNKLLLYKKTSEGAYNYGKEHLAEILASTILDIIEIPHVKYYGDKWHDKYCCTCEIFTNEEIGYLPMSYFLLGNNMDRSEWNYKTIINLISEKDKLQLDDMLVFDFIIENWDRHLSNFGMLINNDTQEILGLAPIFDNGYSLMARDISTDFIGRDYREYTRESPSFNISNRELAYYVINQNKKRYKHWAKLIVTNLQSLEIKDCPNWYMKGVLNLIKSRCEEMEAI